MTARTDAMTVACPFCDAPIGELCTGTRGKLRQSVHAERHIAFVKTTTRHPADITPWQHPPTYDEPPEPGPAHVQHPLTDDTRQRGLRHLHAIRNPAPETDPPW